MINGMRALVLQSDFGLSDGAVCAMHGVAVRVSPDLRIHDLTHEIPPFDIWEGAYRLAQVLPFWPEGTVFVSVVDPGVGSARLSVVARTTTGHLVVTPNNGSLTHVAAVFGIEELRQIDETINRLPGTERSHTFHGRDIYAYTGARLASGKINFEDVGPAIGLDYLEQLPVREPYREGNHLIGTIDALDVRYGSLWTSIPRALFDELGLECGAAVRVEVRHHGSVVHGTRLSYQTSFASVAAGEPLVYVNSLERMAIAINRGNYARAFSLGCGSDWEVSLIPID